MTPDAEVVPAAVRLPHLGRRREGGFSMLELALVLLVAGVLTAGGVALMSSANNQSQSAAQIATANSVKAAILEFVLAQRRLPCPADGDGQEDCSSGHLSGTVPYLALGMTVPVASSANPPLRYAVMRFPGSADLTNPISTAGPFESTIASAGVVTDGSFELVSALRWAAMQPLTTGQPYVTTAGAGCGSAASDVAFALSYAPSGDGNMCFAQTDTWVSVDTLLTLAYQNIM
ncbi:hypothetical protein [Paraburkholderia heleia]|uniref:hypothetical protein n=1 Tax=Paraburkholderia heleia TaxID=634127 RepID=UPI002AB78F48|nr:hypothetical protein [Paraburkholderia heleia]